MRALALLLLLASAPAAAEEHAAEEENDDRPPAPPKKVSYRLIPPGSPEHTLYQQEQAAAGEEEPEPEPEPSAAKPRASERIEDAAGYTLADIEDPAAQKLLGVLMTQVDLMEQEVEKLKSENKDIRDRLEKTEGKAEAFHSDMQHKIDELVRDKDAGLLSESSLVDSLGLLGVKNATLIAPTLREQGLYSLAQVLALEPPEQLELHHALQREEPAPLSLTIRERVPLVNSLLSLGLQAPAPTAMALQSFGYHSIEDLLVIGESAEAREQLSDELRRYSIAYTRQQQPVEENVADGDDAPSSQRERPVKQTKLSIGDRRAVLGLTELGSLLHITEERRADARKAIESSTSRRRAMIAEMKRQATRMQANRLWKRLFGRARWLDTWLSGASPDSLQQRQRRGQQRGDDGEISSKWLEGGASRRAWAWVVSSTAKLGEAWLPQRVLGVCRMLWLHVLVVLTAVTTPWVHVIVSLSCVAWMRTIGPDRPILHAVHLPPPMPRQQQQQRQQRDAPPP
jgi:hypothetical protein